MERALHILTFVFKLCEHMNEIYVNVCTDDEICFFLMCNPDLACFIKHSQV